jgi:hypothetical protein
VFPRERRERVEGEKCVRYMHIYTYAKERELRRMDKLDS